MKAQILFITYPSPICFPAPMKPSFVCRLHECIIIWLSYQLDLLARVVLLFQCSWGRYSHISPGKISTKSLIYGKIYSFQYWNPFTYRILNWRMVLSSVHEIYYIRGKNPTELFHIKWNFQVYGPYPTPPSICFHARLLTRSNWISGHTRLNVFPKGIFHSHISKLNKNWFLRSSTIPMTAIFCHPFVHTQPAVAWKGLR